MFVLAVLALLLLFAFIGFVFFSLDALLSHPPFVPVPKTAVPAIIEALDLKPGQRLYDLGCGDARVLIAAAAAPGIQAVGIEKNLYPHWLAKRAIRKASAKNIRIIRENFFKTDLRSADRLFLYLFPDVMKKILPKLSAELRPGVRVVSCDFIFKEKVPAEVIDLGRTGPVIAKKLYVYDF